MTSSVPRRAFSAFPASLVVVALAAASLVGTSRARASDGYEVGMLGGGVTVLTLGLDVTFIVATATGLTYEDEGWAIAQVTWSSASIAAAGVGIGLAVQEGGFDGLVGGLLLAAGGQAVLLGYAIDALARGTAVDETWADLHLSVGVTPLPEGAMASIGWRG